MLDSATSFGAWKHSSQGLRNISSFPFAQSGDWKLRSPGYINNTPLCHCRASEYWWQVVSLVPYCSTQQLNLQDKRPQQSYWDEYMTFSDAYSIRKQAIFMGPFWLYSPNAQAVYLFLFSPEKHLRLLHII